MTKISPTPPYYPFHQADTYHLAEYLTFFPLQNIPVKYCMSIKTDYDAFVLCDTREECLSRIHDLRTLSKQDIITKYDLRDKPAGSTWVLDDILEEFRAYPPHHDFSSHIHPTLHKPFQLKYFYYTNTTSLVSVKQYPVHHHILQCRDNLSLLFTKVTNNLTRAHTPFVTSLLPQVHVVATGTGSCNFTFPLFLDSSMMGEPAQSPNISLDFTRTLQRLYGTKPTPLQIFGYIYSILHHKIYRSLYLPYLTLDYPRIPLVRSHNDFMTLSSLGEDLLLLHSKMPVPPHHTT